jgi:hypothetical protein
MGMDYGLYALTSLFDLLGFCISFHVTITCENNYILKISSICTYYLCLSIKGKLIFLVCKFGLTLYHLFGNLMC